MAWTDNQDGTWTAETQHGPMVVPRDLVPLDVLAQGLNAPVPPPPPMPDLRTADNAPPPMTPEQAAIAAQIAPTHAAGPPPPPPARSDATPVGDWVNAVPPSGAPAGPKPVMAQPTAPAEAPPGPAAPPGEPKVNLAAMAEGMGNRGGAAVKVPAQNQLQGFTVRRQAPISPEAQQAVEAGYEAQADAATAGAERLAAGAEEAAAGYEAQRQNAEAELDRVRKMEAMRDDVLRPKLAALEQKADAIRSFKVDPDQIWHERGAYSKVLAQIGSAFMAAGQAYAPGMRNVAADQMNAEVERSLQAQQLQLEAIKGGFQADLNTLAEQRSLFQSPEAANAATRALLFHAAESDARRIAAENGGPEALAKGEELAAGFQSQAAQWKAKAEELEKGEIGETFRHIPEHTVGVGGGNPAMEFLKNRAKTYAAMGYSPEDARVQAGRDFASTFGVQPRNGGPMTKFEEEQAKARGAGTGTRTVEGRMELELQEQQKATEATLKQLDEYEQTNLGYNKDLFNWDKRKHAHSVAEETRATLINNVLKAHNEQNTKIAEEMIPAAGVTTSDAAIRAGVQAAQARTMRDLNAARASRGLPPVTLEQVHAQMGIGAAGKPAIPQGFTPIGGKP